MSSSFDCSSACSCGGGVALGVAVSARSQRWREGCAAGWRFQRRIACGATRPSAGWAAHVAGRVREDEPGPLVREDALRRAQLAPVGDGLEEALVVGVVVSAACVWGRGDGARVERGERGWVRVAPGEAGSVRCVFARAPGVLQTCTRDELFRNHSGRSEASCARGGRGLVLLVSAEPRSSLPMRKSNNPSSIMRPSNTPRLVAHHEPRLHEGHLQPLPAAPQHVVRGTHVREVQPVALDGAIEPPVVEALCVVSRVVRRGGGGGRRGRR